MLAGTFGRSHRVWFRGFPFHQFNRAQPVQICLLIVSVKLIKLFKVSSPSVDQECGPPGMLPRFGDWLI